MTQNDSYGLTTLKSRHVAVDGILATRGVEDPLGEKGIGRLSAMRLGKRLHKETARLDDTHLNVLEIDWRVFRDHSDACSKKNRIISRLASGPRGSVYDPTVLPPDQAWPPPCSTHCSRTGFPRSPT
jgi:DNA topoisomerase IB